MAIQLHGLIETFRFFDFIDILLVAVILYLLYKSIKDTRALSLLKGLVVLALISLVSRFLDLHVVSWLIQQSLTIIMVALPVVFQPELRRALERLGRGGFFVKAGTVAEEDVNYMLDEVESALRNMARTKTGALLIFEREVGLGEIIDTGRPIDAVITRELIETIFFHNSPLHDGAVVIRGNRIMAAGCLLPMTSNKNLPTELGTRHRAAIGLSEQADAYVFVVSEETGKISYANMGRLYRNLEYDNRLHEALLMILGEPEGGIARFWKRGGSK